MKAKLTSREALLGYAIALIDLNHYNHLLPMKQVTYKGNTHYFEEHEGQFFPVGGGFSISSFPNGATITEVDQIPTTLVEGVCFFEDGPRFKCLCNPINRWNGWAKPLLLASEIPKFIKEYNNEYYTAKMDGTTLVLSSVDNDEPVRIDLDDRLYDLGNIGWCWDFEG